MASCEISFITIISTQISHGYIISFKLLLLHGMMAYIGPTVNEQDSTSFYTGTGIPLIISPVETDSACPQLVYTWPWHPFWMDPVQKVLAQVPATGLSGRQGFSSSRYGTSLVSLPEVRHYITVSHFQSLVLHTYLGITAAS